METPRTDRRRWGALVLVVAALAAPVACSDAGGRAGVAAGKGGDTSEAGRSGAGQTAAGMGGAATAGSGTLGGSAGTTVIQLTDAGADPDAATQLEPDAACGIGTAEATLLPVSMLLMFDRSGSMVNEDTVDPETQLNRWQTATSALSTFVRATDADGLRVALRFFPDDRPEPGCTEGVCDAAACARPLVDSAELRAEAAPADAQEGALVDAIDAATPVWPMNGGTPISVALEGAATWATSYQALHADGRTVILLVTDGEPRGCDERFWFLTSYASDALATADVKTFAIGLTDPDGAGVNQEDMDSLALAGGTDQAYFIHDGPTASADLLDALKVIRGRSLGCDFPVPEATTAGQRIDPNLVNVTYTSGDGVDTEFTNAHDRDDCEESSSWYYDDTAQRRIHLCPAACDLVSSDPMARFRILAGCAPIMKEPR